MHLVTFDVDGTLVLSDGVDDGCYLEALLKVLRIDNASPDWDSYTSVTDPGIVSELVERLRGGPATPEELAAVEGDYFDRLSRAVRQRPGCIRAVAGALELVERLRARDDVAVAFATGAWFRAVVLRLRAAGFSPDAIPMASGSDATTRDKIVAMAAARAKTHYGVAEFESQTHVGDRMSDLEAAQALGFDFVGVTVESGNADAFREAGARVIVEDFRELPGDCLLS